MTELQLTAEWFAARLGKLTASRYSDAMAKTKTGWGASRENYKFELVAERLSHLPYPRFQTMEMKWGNDNQQLAIDRYSYLREVDVDKSGFVPHPTIAMSGASPDGLIGDDGLIEVKCPNTATHLLTKRGASIPLSYVAQVQWQLICTDRKWCDWVSFDPRILLPGKPIAELKLQFEIRRINRVPPDIQKLMERDAINFLDEVAYEHEILLAMIERHEAASEAREPAE